MSAAFKSLVSRTTCMVSIVELHPQYIPQYLATMRVPGPQPPAPNPQSDNRSIPLNALDTTDIMTVAARRGGKMKKLYWMIPAGLTILGAGWILQGAGGKSDKIDTKDLLTGQQA